MVQSRSRSLASRSTPSEGKGPRSAAAPDQRRAILLAASRVFRERGVHGSGMRDVAAAAGIAVGKLYYWFRDKSQILAWCQREGLSRLVALAEGLSARSELSCAARLGLVLQGHLRVLNEDAPGSLAHLETEGLAERDRESLLPLRDRYEQLLRGLVTVGKRAGEFREDVDPKLSVLALLGAVNWSVKWYRPGGGDDLETIARAFARQIIGGLCKEPVTWPGPAEAAAILDRILSGASAAPAPEEMRGGEPQ